MKSDNIRKHMLIRNGAKANMALYRVLAISDKILVIDCQKKVMPVWKIIEELEGFVEVEEKQTGLFEDVEDMEAERKRIAYQRFNLISGIIPFVADEQ